MTEEMPDALRRNISRLVTGELSEFNFAVGGPYALSIHGLSSRKSQDIDFFADAEDIWAMKVPDYGSLRDRLHDALENGGYTIEDVMWHKEFARFIVSAGNMSISCDLTKHRRLNPLVTLDGIRVIDLRDASGGKLHALAERAFAKDLHDSIPIIVENNLELSDVVAIASTIEGTFYSLDVVRERILDATLGLRGDSLIEYGVGPDEVESIRIFYLGWL